MLNLYKNIRFYRRKNDWSQDELARRVGYADKSMVSKIEKGLVDLPQSAILKFADVFGVAPGDLMGDVERDNRIPVLGRVAAGIPIDAIEDVIDYEDIPDEMAKRGEYFGLKVKGDSMQPRIYDGDVVIVRKQPDAESGQIVVASVNGEDATCKRLALSGNGVALISLNPAYPPMMYSKQEQTELPIHIYGVVVEIRGKLKGI